MIVDLTQLTSDPRSGLQAEADNQGISEQTLIDNLVTRTGDELFDIYAERAAAAVTAQVLAATTEQRTAIDEILNP